MKDHMSEFSLICYNSDRENVAGFLNYAYITTCIYDSTLYVGMMRNKMAALYLPYITVSQNIYMQINSMYRNDNI